MADQNEQPVQWFRDKKLLSEKMLDMARSLGATSAGITTIDTLVGGPPSTDLEYVLPGAKSAITFAVPYDEDKIRDYLAKRDREPHLLDSNRMNTLATGIAAQIAGYLRHFDYPSVGLIANEVYRKDENNQRHELFPDISHRLLAARGGVGWFGLSGNIMVPKYGANVSLATAVTTVELEPTEPLRENENPCNCDTMECVSACPSGFLHKAKKDMQEVTMGNVTFSYGRRLSYSRCAYVCAGFSGLHPSGKWSTWSPGRFPIPKEDEDLMHVVPHAIQAWDKRPAYEGAALSQPQFRETFGKDIQKTCSNCMLVCGGSPEERSDRLKTLQSSGVVIQHEDGLVEAVTADAATAHLEAMSPEVRARYEPENPEAFAEISVYGRKPKRN